MVLLVLLNIVTNSIPTSSLSTARPHGSTGFMFPLLPSVMYTDASVLSLAPEGIVGSALVSQVRCAGFDS